MVRKWALCTNDEDRETSGKMMSRSFLCIFEFLNI